MKLSRSVVVLKPNLEDMVIADTAALCASTEWFYLSDFCEKSWSSLNVCWIMSKIMVAEAIF